MKNYLKVENKLYHINNTLTNHVKQSKIKHTSETQKTKTIFVISQDDLLSLIYSLKPVVKKGYHYIILSSQRTVRVSEQLYVKFEQISQKKTVTLVSETLIKKASIT
jgi:hypothetical protein